MAAEKVYNVVRSTTFKEIVMGAGVILDTFEPTTGTVDPAALLCSSSGGFAFADKPDFKDLGADIDNCPKNTKELKKIDKREVTITGTSVTFTAALAARLAAAADVSEDKITPRDALKAEDFKDLWWVGEYGDKEGGMMAIHMMNTLSTGGLGFQTTDREKMKGNFVFTAHYSMAAQSTVPYEIYIKTGGVVV